jgi:hypothetical protein
MSKNYSGMCIGGPKDGEHASCGEPSLKAYWPLPLPPAPILSEAVPTTTVVDRFTYRHVAFHFRNSKRPEWEETRGFWTPSDVEDQHLHVLDMLAKAYRARTSQDKGEPTNG